MTLPPNRFCVYVIHCPWSKRPIYVGKGHRRQRAHEHLRAERTNDDMTAFIRKCRRNGREPTIEYPHEGLTNTEASQREDALIREYGRKDNGTGILLNRTGGGSGHVPRGKLDPTWEIVVLPLPHFKVPLRGARLQRYNDLISSKTVGEFGAKQRNWREWERTIRRYVARGVIDVRPPLKKQKSPGTVGA
jgi:hypothetical protein